ncbi:interferon-related developmental regulator 2 isoform X1 [Hydra vulgaris]|uniref:Interferon-related developmental regulator 2 n=1 Tax=Hydra vulgaris TaxID=6087 RepID=T2MDQ8_HYDVU|nr:interferon-related developmental regulator 2 [Hydra vulgaris]
MEVQTSRSKKKTSKRRNPKKKSANDAGSDENDSDDDIESVASSVDLTFNAIEDGLEYNENFEQKFLDSIEGAREKSAKVRQVSLMEIKNGLCQRYLYDFLLSRKDSLLDLVEKLLKKGQPEDCIISSDISSILCIQLGVADASHIFTTLKSIFINILGDESASPLVRASAASALGIVCFIGCEEPEDTVVCLNALKTSFMKKIPADTSHHVPIANSLLSWSLLLTVVPSSVVEENISSCISVMCRILELGDLNLRIAAGETLALIYELARDSNIRFQGPVPTLYSLLRDLANESGRHKGKREKKQQKASFRDFLKSIERGVNPTETINFGGEYLEMSSWIWVRRYNAFKDALGCGINIHLKYNSLLREIFDLGLPITNQIKLSKNEKYERQLINEACSKDRTLARGLKRDNKRSGLT